jgi:hypothetical protein
VPVFGVHVVNWLTKGSRRKCKKLPTLIGENSRRVFRLVVVDDARRLRDFAVVRAGRAVSPKTQVIDIVVRPARE